MVTRVNNCDQQFRSFLQLPQHQSHIVAHRNGRSYDYTLESFSYSKAAIFVYSPNEVCVWCGFHQVWHNSTHCIPKSVAIHQNEPSCSRISFPFLLLPSEQENKTIHAKRQMALHLAMSCHPQACCPETNKAIPLQKWDRYQTSNLADLRLASSLLKRRHMTCTTLASAASPSTPKA